MLLSLSPLNNIVIGVYKDESIRINDVCDPYNGYTMDSKTKIPNSTVLKLIVQYFNDKIKSKIRKFLPSYKSTKKLFLLFVTHIIPHTIVEWNSRKWEIFIDESFTTQTSLVQF